jgi:hypothetical protein
VAGSPFRHAMRCHEQASEVGVGEGSGPAGALPMNRRQTTLTWIARKENKIVDDAMLGLRDALEDYRDADGKLVLLDAAERLATAASGVLRYWDFDRGIPTGIDQGAR